MACCAIDDDIVDGFDWLLQVQTTERDALIALRRSVADKAYLAFCYFAKKAR